MSFRTVYGNTKSENGWRMVNRDACVLVQGPYMNTAPLRAGAPAVVLGDFARRYHLEVAPITSPVWGWSLTNDVGNSNHLSGTAVDINAPQWPWGYYKMPQALINKVNNLLQFYTLNGSRGVFWGRVWNKPDEMHFQCGWPEGDARWDQLLKKIQGNAPLTPGGNEIYAMLGDRGPRVTSLQNFFNDNFPAYAGIVVDGVFGPRLEEVVREFQTRPPRIAVDGIVGTETLGKLQSFGYKPVPKEAPVAQNKIFPKDYTDRELLEYIATQLGPTQAGWSADSSLGRNSKGEELTLRDGVARGLRMLEEKRD